MGTPPKAFYPWLMDLPRLTPEARQFIEEEATRRLSAGSQAISQGQAGLHHALASNDPAGLQAAAAGLRLGLQNIESGTAALRALRDGAAPRQIALAWFRGQTGLDQQAAAMNPGPFGWSWFHLIAMLFLGAFVLGTLLIQFARMRRISELTARLAARPAGTAVPAPVLPPVTSAVGSVNPSVPSAPAIAVDKARPIARASRWSGPLRVAAIFRETHDVKTFRMVNPDGGVLPFSFLPGQFLTFSVEIDGKRVRRSYTIASSPAVTAHLEVTVKRQEHHGVSAFLHDRVKFGDLLDIAAASGRFTFTGEEDSIVLIAGGVGITPMMSVIRYLTDMSFPGEIFLLYGARSTEDFIFREELEYLQRRHENLHIAATMARAAGTAWMGPEGPVTKDFINQAVPEIARRHIHLCGPPPMMEAVKAELMELGVPKERIETEAFGPAEGMVPQDALETDIIEVKGAPGPAPAKRDGTAAGLAPAQVRFSVSKKTGPLRPDQSVLEAAEAIGVDIDYSCRVGTCGTCRVRLLEGAVTMAVEEGLQPGDKERGVILACQAKSAGNLVVEA
ncbi:MAG: 2Fe-2S iron-sulfur cluster-binding protein [Rhizobiaceae bacterium]